MATVLEFRPSLRILPVICTIYGVFLHNVVLKSLFIVQLSQFFTLDLILLRVTKLIELLFGHSFLTKSSIVFICS